MASPSQPFDRLMNGSIKEAQESCAELPDNELELFLLLVEFAYCRNYTVKPCSYDSSESRKENTRWVELEKELLEENHKIQQMRVPKSGVLSNRSLKAF